MFIFPAHLFTPDSVQARLVQKTASGGVSLAGDEDVILTDGGGRWEITYSGIALDTPRALRAWEAWNDYLAGGTVDCLVPLLSVDTAPRPWQGYAPIPAPDLVADDPIFPTSIAYSGGHIEAVTGAIAGFRATSLEIIMVRGAPIEGGERFSVGGRGYRIGARVSGNVWRISPPLRASIPAGTPVNFDWPVVQCRGLPGADNSPAIQFGDFAETAITFRESF